MLFKDNPAISWQKFNESLWTTPSNLFFIQQLQKDHLSTLKLDQEALVLQDLINHGYLYQHPHTKVYTRQKPSITYRYSHQSKGRC